MIIKVTCVFVVISLCTSAWGLTIVTDGSSDYSIFIPNKPIPSEITAAQELAQHIEKMSGARLPIRSDWQFKGSPGILLGNSEHLEKLGVKPDWKQLGKEGYLFRVADGHLIIAGGRPRGTLYGVYWLLEKHLGCRWFTPDTTVIPKHPTVSLPELDFVGAPAYEYREPVMHPAGSGWWGDNFSQEYVARTRNSALCLVSAWEAGWDADEREQRQHMMAPRYGGFFKIPHHGHNLGGLVTPEKYGQTNPEYFALQPDGRRITTGPSGFLSLCLTHPDVLRIASETMLEWMRASPDADMFFVGQGDSGVIKTCQCERCLAVKKKYGGFHSGENIKFVNEIAKRVEKEFPNALIGTYAYEAANSNTNRAPENIKAHKNVVVWFCPMTRCFCHPLHEGLLNKGFYKYADELEKWTMIASKVYVYDYNHIYKHFSKPGVDPPLDLLKLPETYEFYRRMGVEGIEVDSLKEMQLGYQFLRYWLMTQMMNDADFDFQRGMDEFLEAYYGRAARYIREFIELACDPSSYAPATPKRATTWYAEGSDKWNELRHDCLVNWRHLSAEAIEAGYETFEKARWAVAADAAALAHVEAARMPLQYAMLEYLPAEDTRLKEEAVSYFNLGGKLQLQSVGDGDWVSFSRR